MTATTTIDEQRAQEFTGRVLTDTAALTTTVLAAIGDRLGLFKNLAAAGPATPAELAARTGTNERYVREWAAGLHAAGYLEHDNTDARFALPPEYAATLASEPGPAFFGGVHQELLGAVQRYDRVVEAFRNGGGVPSEDLHPDVWEGTARFTAQWHQNMLVQQWMPLLPDVAAKLTMGARVADVGCGAGQALVVLAQRYPASSFVGYDVHAPAIERAQVAAAHAGVDDRVGFEVLDASKGLPERFDVIATFDVVHDAVNPLGLLRAIRDALEPGGIHVCLDINCAERAEDNVGPIASLLYGFSVLYCMTTSLAHGGAGLGTMGLTPSTLRELADKAGFAGVRQVEMDNPFNTLYELRR
jgi:2-polyprenyl-3-methyl-5-hydroxy-6-metoxy-1,4-benzoquinol methylase